MCVAGLSTLMAVCNHIIGDPFAQALIEYEVFPNKLVLESLLTNLTSILNYAPVQLKYIRESNMFHPCARLFTADATGAIHHDVLVLLFSQQVAYNLKLITKSVGIRTYRIAEMPHLTFIMIAHIDDDGVVLVGERVEFPGIHVLPGPCNVEFLVSDPISDDFATNLDLASGL
jgi:hypothetical protein